MAGYSEEIMSEAKSVIMPTAKTGDESDEEDKDSKDDSSDNERVNMKGKKKNNGIKKQDKLKTY